MYLVHPNAIVELADDTATAWRRIDFRQLEKQEDELDKLIGRTFFSLQLRPTQVAERLKSNPVWKGSI